MKLHNCGPGDSPLNTAAIVMFMHARRDQLPNEYARVVDRAVAVIRRPLGSATREDTLAIMCVLELYARHLLGRLGEDEV